MRLLFTICLLFSTLLLSHAQIFVRHDATGTNDGSSWANAFTNLQDALDASTSGAQIWIAAGTYIPLGPTPDSSHFLTTNPVQLYGGFSGTETNISTRDWNANPTIISGDVLQDDIQGDFDLNRTDNAHHVLIINAPGTQSVIDGLVFEGGTTRQDTYSPTAIDIPYNRWSGGALYLYQSGAMIRNSLFLDNDGIRGSGIFAFADTLHVISLQVDNTIIRNNNGFNGSGGFFQAYKDIQITNTEVSGNTGVQGAGLFFSGSNATVKNCVLDSNVATYGGAIMSYHTNLYVKHHEMNVFNCSFTGNSASSWGGGLHVYNVYESFTVNVDSSSFTGNFGGTGGYGGGIEIWDQLDALQRDPLSTIKITNSEFIDNDAAFGGGVEIETEDDSIKIILENVKFEANTAIRGGGLNVYAYANSKVDLYMRNGEFTANFAAIAGGMSMEGINNTFPAAYLLEDCSFKGNIAQNGVGALNIQHHPRPDGISGTIRRTLFEDNFGGGLSGGFTVFRGNHLIEDSYFLSNSTDATFDSLYHGGGAVNFNGPAVISMDRNVFEGNTSLTDGAGITANADVVVTLENNLFHQQEGNSTIFNEGILNLANNTFSGNQYGFRTLTGSATTFQNNIFNNDNDNLIIDGKPTIISLGGNISNDASMSGTLEGHNQYADLHNTDPLLGADFVPLDGSPAVDAGNPENILMPFDLAGNPRISGNSIDAGSYESFAVATEDALWNTQSFTVFPNPVNESLNFQLKSDWTGEFKLVMYNYSGQQIVQTELFKTGGIQSFQYDIHNLSSGEYVILVTTDSKTYASNIIIEN